MSGIDPTTPDCRTTALPTLPPSRVSVSAPHTDPETGTVVRSGSQFSTCSRGFDLLHVRVQHFRVPGAVRTEFGVETGSDVFRRHVSSSGVAGGDFGVPVRFQSVVPVDVLPVRGRIAVEREVENMNVVKDRRVRGSGSVDAAGPVATTRGGGVTRPGTPVHPYSDGQRLRAQRRLGEDVGGS